MTSAGNNTEWKRIIHGIVNLLLLVFRLTILSNHVIPEDSVPKTNQAEQLDLFTDYVALEKHREKENAALE